MKDVHDSTRRFISNKNVNLVSNFVLPFVIQYFLTILIAISVNNYKLVFLQAVIIVFIANTKKSSPRKVVLTIRNSFLQL